jgi:hypothetical protein
MIQEIAQLIENRTTWVIDSTMFIGHLPSKTMGGIAPPERVVVLLENTPPAVIGQLPDRQDKEVQVLNRARTFFTARADATAIYRLLHGLSWVDLPVLTSGEEWTAMIIDAVAAPAPIENPNAQGIFTFSTNYIFRMKDTDK